MLFVALTAAALLFLALVAGGFVSIWGAGAVSMVVTAGLVWLQLDQTAGADAPAQEVVAEVTIPAASSSSSQVSLHT